MTDVILKDHTATKECKWLRMNPLTMADLINNKQWIKKMNTSWGQLFKINLQQNQRHKMKEIPFKHVLYNRHTREN